MAEVSSGSLITPTVRLVRELGAGGMGRVWLADHLALHAPVVVKFMSASLAQDPANVTRFSREAAAASQVRSPHVVQMLDHGVTKAGLPYIVMEYLEGRDLRAYLDQRRRVPLREVALIVAQVCKALSRAHERGIVHRDIKPENIFLCDHGGDEFFVKILDFGIAKGGASLGTATATGAVIGSPLYMSPEQLVGAKTVDLRTDIWSLGVVTFEALTGGRPYEGETIGAMTLAVHTGELPLPSQRVSDLPPGLDAWFAGACAREPTKRFGTAAALAKGFANAIRGFGDDDETIAEIAAVSAETSYMGPRPAPQQSDTEMSGPHQFIDVGTAGPQRTEIGIGPESVAPPPPPAPPAASTDPVEATAKKPDRDITVPDPEAQLKASPPGAMTHSPTTSVIIDPVAKRPKLALLLGLAAVSVVGLAILIGVLVSGPSKTSQGSDSEKPLATPKATATETATTATEPATATGTETSPPSTATIAKPSASASGKPSKPPTKPTTKPTPPSSKSDASIF